MTESEALRRLDILVQRYFDAELTAPEGRELLILWEEHPEYRQALEDQYKTEHLLRFRAPSVSSLVELYNRSVASPDGSETFDWLDDIVHLEKTAPVLVAPQDNRSRADNPPFAVPPRPLSPHKEMKSKTSFILCAISLVLLFSVAIFFEFRSPQTSHQTEHFLSHGVVDAVLDVRWSGGTEPLKSGQSITTERIRFDSGLLQIRLDNGVRLALEGPVDFKVNSEKHVFCGLGELSATVSETGKGFEVQTPFGGVVDLGTEFSLRIADSRVETHTHQGRVLINRLPRNEIVQLPAGKAFSIDSAGEKKHFAADPKRFQSEKKVREEVELHDDRVLAKWETELDHWSRDSNLLLLFDFQQDGTTLSNRAPRGTFATTTLSGVRRTTGRWTGKKAVAIASKRDAVGIDLPTELRSLTLSASARIDSLRRYNHFLLASESQGPGHVVWQIWGDGSLHFSVGPPTGRAPVHFASPRHFSRKHWGAWYDLAVVFDAEKKSVIHYVDGEEIARNQISDANLPIRIGPATIGNGLLQGKRLSDCSFDGRFEEFLAFDRPLSPEEIRRLHNR